jgi:hypothetical protein
VPNDVGHAPFESWQPCALHAWGPGTPAFVDFDADYQLTEPVMSSGLRGLLVAALELRGEPLGRVARTSTPSILTFAVSGSGALGVFSTFGAGTAGATGSGAAITTDAVASCSSVLGRAASAAAAGGCVGSSMLSSTNVGGAAGRTGVALAGGEAGVALAAAFPFLRAASAARRGR